VQNCQKGKPFANRPRGAFRQLHGVFCDFRSPTARACVCFFFPVVFLACCYRSFVNNRRPFGHARFHRDRHSGSTNDDPSSGAARRANFTMVHPPFVAPARTGRLVNNNGNSEKRGAFKSRARATKFETEWYGGLGSTGVAAFSGAKPICLRVGKCNGTRRHCSTTKTQVKTAKNTIFRPAVIIR